MTGIFRTKAPWLSVVLFFCFFPDLGLARESKQKRKENALTVRNILTYLPRISDAYQAGRYDAAAAAFDRSEVAFLKIKDKFQGQSQKRLTKKFLSLGDALKRRVSLQAVINAQTVLYEEIIEIFSIEDTPAQIPDKILGEDVYKARCAGCHGVDGKVGTALAKRLNPVPSDLTREPLASSLSPFRVYNVLLTGLDGTSKAPFDNELSDHELWSVAFYTLMISCAPVSEQTTGKAGDALTLQMLATQNNVQLQAKHSDQSICALRSAGPYRKGMPRK